MANLWQKAPSGSLFPIDFGISEALGIGKANPAVTQQGGALFYSPQPQAARAVNTSNLPSFSGTGAINNNNPAVLAASTGRRTTSAPAPQNNQPQQQQGQQGPSLEDQVNAVYNPINDFLNQMAQEYQAGQAPAQANIESSFGRQLTPINEKEQTELGIQNKQEGVINTGEQNALAQARQVYNELQQRNVALYGTGSSAGPAANELLGRTTAKQFGDIGSTATAGRTAVEEERGNIKKFAEQKRVDLNAQKEEAIRTLQAEFRDGMLKIGQMKAQNESAKAAARLDLLQRAQEQAFQIEQADKAYQRAIDQFERESAITSNANAAFSSATGRDAEAIQGFNGILNAVNSGQLTKSQAYIAGVQMGLPDKFIGTALGTLDKPKDDELSNPFAGGQ